MKDARADVATSPLAVAGRPSSLADFVSLTKPRLNVLVVATSAAGYYLGAVARPDLIAMAEAVAGTAMVAGGAAALNQVYERDTDALMRRTRNRPLPDARLTTGEATLFGLALAGAGLAMLAACANLLAALLALTTLLTYVLWYTPLKRRSPAATLVGAIPGALPPLIGWAASRGDVSVGGLALFAIVFLWQIPHFMAIAWLYREDYGRAGFPMLPVIDPTGDRVGLQAVIYAVLLVPASIIPTLVGLSGLAYLVFAVLSGLALVGLAIRFAATHREPAARALFIGSITYLPLLWMAMILAKR
ncbi:MAG TPA: heme o synthase [Vicinamibacterales bacterium]|nr:heme o synthase [Vicinamibacterales bacterium]